MHILRSERLGTLWCGVAVLVCLWVEGWRALNPVVLEPLAVSDVLRALESMPGPLLSPDGAKGSWSHEGQKANGALRFDAATGPIMVGALDSAGWVNLGLSPLQARAAVRYNRAVGGIRDQRTLSRMRALPEGWMDHYEAALQFDPSFHQKAATRNEEDRRTRPARTPSASFGERATAHEAAAASCEVTPVMPLDINVADSLTLLSVHGIGPWVTGRILAARRRWGGFAEMSQLTEALDGWDSLATALSPLLTADAGRVSCRCADTLSLDQWLSLPGLNPKSARVLERYVHHHKGARSPLLAHPILDSAQSRLLSHYLCPCRHE